MPKKLPPDADTARDELAERRTRAPRPPRFSPAQAAAPAEREHDRRRRVLSASTLSCAYAELVKWLDTNPRAMESMLRTANDVAACHAARAAPVEDCWCRLEKAISECRDEVEELADVGELKRFNEWALSRTLERPSDEDEQFDRLDLIANSLTSDQHLVWLASAFADDAAIARYMDIGEDYVRKHRERVRRRGVPDEHASTRLLDLILILLRRDGVDIDALAGDIDGLDPHDSDAMAASFDDYEMALLDLMRARA